MSTPIRQAPITLQGTAGGPIEIVLSATPGAGLTWHAPDAPAGCTVTPGAAVRADGAIGGAVDRRFLITCVRPGRVDLSFEYKRPWEAEVRAIQPVVVVVR